MTNALSTIKLFEVSKLNLLRVLDSTTETLKNLSYPFMYSLVFHLGKHAYRFNCFLYNFCTLDSFDNLSSTDCDDVKPSSHVLASPGNDLYSVKKRHK